jgi:hypothetical protein
LGCPYYGKEFKFEDVIARFHLGDTAASVVDHPLLAILALRENCSNTMAAGVGMKFERGGPVGVG